jgi:hypothetical protein
MSAIDLLRKISFHLVILLAATSAAAADGIRVLETRAVAGEAPAGGKAVTHDLRLQLHTFRGSRWGAGDAVLAAWEAASVLSQCGIAFAGGEVRLLEVPERFHQYSAPTAQELMRAASFTKPAVFFIESIRDRPTQTSESVDRADSAAHPELADTVWLVYGEYDAVLTLAHELVHVLTDNSEHSSEAGNLMNAEYSPTNFRLTEGQCARVRERGEANGLLKRR